MLEHVRTRPLEGDHHVRIFHRDFPPGLTDAERALRGNHASKARYAQPNGAVAMLYLGQNARVAAWETVLSESAPDEDGGVYVPPAALHRRALATLHRTDAAAPACLDLRAPHRYACAARGTDFDLRWNYLGQTGSYPETHAAIAACRAQFTAAGRELLGVVYPSLRHQGDFAAVFYLPPMQVPPWTCPEDPVPLDTAAGAAALDALLVEDDYYLIADPIDDPDAKPPEDDDG